MIIFSLLIIFSPVVGVHIISQQAAIITMPNSTAAIYLDGRVLRLKVEGQVREFCRKRGNVFSREMASMFINQSQLSIYTELVCQSQYTDLNFFPESY